MANLILSEAEKLFQIDKFTGIDRRASDGARACRNFRVLSDGSLDFSFSGLKTAAINLLHRYEQSGKEFSRELFAARYTFEAVEAVAKKIGIALSENPGLDLAVSGGVAANSHIRSALARLCEKRGIRFIVPDRGLCGDNAAMIAAAGFFQYQQGNFADTSLNASAADEI